MDHQHDPDLQEVQSEFAFTTVHNPNLLQERLRGLCVSDHPRAAGQVETSSNTPPVPSVRVRRNSAGDETMLFCDFGDFNTQELISSPIQFDHAPTAVESHTPVGGDLLAYSTHSESSHAPLLPRPIPYTPTPPLPQQSGGGGGVVYQNTPLVQQQQPPLLPPKSQIPPPYRPPPPQQWARPHMAFEEEPFTKVHTLVGGAMSSSDGGSHDSHNDSGYCAVRCSGGPSPSLSGNITFKVPL